MNEDVLKLKEITVLYCEDEANLREVTGGILISFTKKQFICEDGLEGLETFKKYQNEIDLIITDVNMPNMTGLEMAKEIKAINVDIPIIVATAFSNSEYLLEAIDLGIDKYVLKPVNIKKLLDVMSKSLLYHELRDLYSDNLTHLKNRNALLRDMKKKQGMTTLALLDIDNFSVLNDLYGEENGDTILIQFTQELQKVFKKPEYNIYRVGADKFIVLACNDSVLTTDLENLSKKFTTYMDHFEIVLPEDSINISFTIGIASCDDGRGYDYVQRIVQKAKKQFIQILTYDETNVLEKNDYKENIKWIKKLKNGLESGNFQPYFQPIVDATTQQIYKYEALVRYIEDDGTEIPPYKFLPIAKKAKLYPVIIKVMLQSVVDVIKDKKIRVAVNVSFEDIINKDTRNFITEVLSNNLEEAKLIDFEILESEEIEDFELVKDFITNIKQYGCNIGVDDFGAGYSNFNMLEALNIDFVKIDGSLIKDIDTLPKQALIVETISIFCQKLGVKTVAEYVCSQNIYETTRDLNIDYMQGYYFSKPISKSEL